MLPVLVEREGGPGGPGGPGASGRIAAIDGKTVQVQDEMSGQVAVTWTGKTDFTAEVDADLDDVTVGSCVAVMDDQVRITEAMDGECGRPGGPGGDGPPPSDMPSDGPVRIGGTVGEVTAVSDTGFTVGDEQVTVSADTTYVRMAEADAGCPGGGPLRGGVRRGRRHRRGHRGADQRHRQRRRPVRHGHAGQP